MTAPLVEVHDLVVRYKSRGLFAAPFKPAVNGVTLSLPAGSTLGLVGESGSGKSSLLRALLRLVPVESGTISLGGQDWLAIDGPALRRARHSIGFVAQNPFLSLSPRLTIAQILAEPLLARTAQVWAVGCQPILTIKGDAAAFYRNQAQHCAQKAAFA